MNARAAVLLLGALGGLVLTAEAGLRVVGMLSAGSDPLRIEAAPRAERVLVVGDAASFGVGVARQHVWPAQLDARAPRYEVHVRTRPRLHSEDALCELPEWLAETRPEIVILSLGADDAAVTPVPWSVWERWRIDGRHPGVMLLGEDDGPRDAATLLLGSWRSGATVLEFGSDGRLRLGPNESDWWVDGDTLRLRDDEGGEHELRWQRHRSMLELDGPLVGGRLILEPVDAATDPIGRAQAALAAGDTVAARIRLRQLAALGMPVTPLIAQVDVVEGLAGGPIPPVFAKVALAVDGDAATARGDRLRRAIAACRRAGADVIVVGHAGAWAALDRVDREVAEAAGARFVSVGGVARLAGTDGLPDRDGHAAVAGAIAAVLNERPR